MFFQGFLLAFVLITIHLFGHLACFSDTSLCSLRLKELVFSLQSFQNMLLLLIIIVFGFPSCIIFHFHGPLFCHSPPQIVLWFVALVYGTPCGYQFGPHLKEGQVKALGQLIDWSSDYWKSSKRLLKPFSITCKKRENLTPFFPICSTIYKQHFGKTRLFFSQFLLLQVTFRCWLWQKKRERKNSTPFFTNFFHLKATFWCWHEKFDAGIKI